MAKRRIRNPRAAIKRWEKAGRGQGSGSDYNPWIHIQDKRTGSIVTRVLGWKTNRVHHLLRRMELDYFYCLEWADDVIDICEHRPLQSDETTEIARLCGVKHPTYPKSDVPIVMTTDFFTTVATPTTLVSRACSVVTAKHSTSSRIRPKFEIERQYWRSYGVDWSVVIDADIPRAMARNVGLLHTYRQIADRVQLNAEQIEEIAQGLTRTAVSSTLPLRRLTSSCDDAYSLSHGTCLAIVYHLLATKRWSIDMNVEIDPAKAIRLVSWAAQLES